MDLAQADRLAKKIERLTLVAPLDRRTTTLLLAAVDGLATASPMRVGRSGSTTKITYGGLEFQGPTLCCALATLLESRRKPPLPDPFVPCDHTFVVLREIYLSKTPNEATGYVVPYEWCSRCGTIHHDFLGQLRPENRQTMGTRPIKDQVLVRVDTPEEITSGGIIIPQTAEKKTYTGRVIGKGDGRRTRKGTRIAIDVEVGDRVFFSEFAGNEHPALQSDDDVRHLIIREDEICGVID